MGAHRSGLLCRQEQFAVKASTEGACIDADHLNDEGLRGCFGLRPGALPTQRGFRRRAFGAIAAVERGAGQLHGLARLVLSLGPVVRPVIGPQTLHADSGQGLDGLAFARRESPIAPVDDRLDRLIERPGDYGCSTSYPGYFVVCRLIIHGPW